MVSGGDSGAAADNVRGKEVDIVGKYLPGGSTFGTTFVLGGIVESWRELVVMDGGVCHSVHFCSMDMVAGDVTPPK